MTGLAEARGVAWPEAFRTPEDIHVHVFSLDRLARTGEGPALGLLDREELEALGRIKAPSRRREFVFGRAALRRLLAHYARVGADAVRIVRDGHAKPGARLDDGRALPSFNVSHSGDVLAIALCACGDIGVDVELVEGRSDTDLEGIARSQFSDAEYKVLMLGAREQRLHAFFRMWTLKEAVLKAVGVGLFHPLRQIDVAESAVRYAVAFERNGDELRVAAEHRRLGNGDMHLAVARRGAMGMVQVFDEQGAQQEQGGAMGGGGVPST